MRGANTASPALLISELYWWGVTIMRACGLAAWAAAKRSRSQGLADVVVVQSASSGLARVSGRSRQRQRQTASFTGCNARKPPTETQQNQYARQPPKLPTTATQNKTAQLP